METTATVAKESRRTDWTRIAFYLVLFVGLILASVGFMPGLYTGKNVPVLSKWACEWHGNVWVTSRDILDHQFTAFPNGPGCYRAPS